MWVLWHNVTTVISKLGAFILAPRLWAKLNNTIVLLMSSNSRTNLRCSNTKSWVLMSCRFRLKFHPQHARRWRNFPCLIITGEYSATDKIKISFFMWKCRVSNSKYIFYLIYIFMKFPWFGQIFIQGSHSVKSKIFFSALHILDCFHKSELSPLTSLSSGCWSLITALLRMRPRVRNKRFMLDAEAPGVTRML